jgi:hypothetical protein
VPVSRLVGWKRGRETRGIHSLPHFQNGGLMTEIEIEAPEEEQTAKFASPKYKYDKPVPQSPHSGMPWHRQKGESRQAFEAFMTYLIAGQDRSLTQASNDVGKSRTLIARWSRQWHWVHRVGCYEEHYMLLQLESVEAQRDVIYAKQARLADLATSIVEARLTSLMAQMEEGKLSEEDLKNDSLIRLFSESTKIEKSAIEKRIEGAKELSERRKTIEEEYGEQLAEKLQQIMNELGVDPRKSQKVIRHHLLNV